MKSLFGALLAALFLVSCAAPAKAPTRASTEVLVKSTTSWDGGNFQYPDGRPEITVTTITIPAGVTLPLHCHPVPLAGILAKGTLEVSKSSGESILLAEGDGLIEVSNQWHHGHAVTEAEIMVVYAGAKGVPVTVLPDGDPSFTAGCR